MKTLWIIPALFGAVMLAAAPTMAANNAQTQPKPAKAAKAAPTPADRCKGLEKQFDAAIKKHMKSKNAAEAKMAREDAGKACEAGQHDDGIAKLQGALKSIGVKPKA